jgi:hypothetical protein
VTTMADALGCAARPLARVVATWRSGPAWRRRAVRAVHPALARALDDLAAGIENVLGPLP